MQPPLRHKHADRVSHSSINSSIDSKNPIGKRSLRPSSGVGVLLLDVIGSDVKVGIYRKLFADLLILQCSLIL